MMLSPSQARRFSLELSRPVEPGPPPLEKSPDPLRGRESIRLLMMTLHSSKERTLYRLNHHKQEEEEKFKQVH
jgi:hypothetical protein